MKNSNFEGEKTEFKLGPMKGDICAYRRTKSVNLTPLNDNIVTRTLVALPAVYYAYIGLCSKYDTEDPLSSRMYIKNHVFKAFCASVF